jgi:hypothetical protein
MEKTMTTKHTPGPFEIDGVDRHGWIRIVAPEVNMLIVATVRHATDAALMAEAPAMADVLKEITEVFSRVGQEIEPIEHAREILARISPKARELAAALDAHQDDRPCGSCGAVWPERHASGCVNR